MTDPQPTGDLREFLVANCLGVPMPETIDELLDEVVDLIGQWLGDPAGTPPATFTRQQAADWLSQGEDKP